jgi:hypothetical protein
MFGNWIKKRVQLASVRSVTHDLERFVLSLRGHSDEENGMVIAIATIIRMNMRAEGRLPDAALGVGMPLPDTEQAMAQLGVSRLVQQFQKLKQPIDAAGAMVWLHTLRAFCYPEVRLLGRQMWGKLQRGFPHALDAFAFIERATGTSPPLGSLLASQFVPPGLEPFDN